MHNLIFLKRNTFSITMQHHTGPHLDALCIHLCHTSLVLVASQPNLQGIQ